MRVMSSGVEAQQVMEKRRAKLLIAEFNSLKPAVEGLQSCVQYALRHNIPIIGLTSNRRDAAIAHAISNGQITCFDTSKEMDKFHAKAGIILGARKQRVILGDDDRIVRELLRSRFEAGGFDVLQANDGEEVLACAQSNGADIIVLDRIMPRLDGLAALRMLKTDPRTYRIPVVMLTTKASPEQIAEGRRDGATAYILKPFSPDEVVLKCVDILDGNPRSDREFASYPP